MNFLKHTKKMLSIIVGAGMLIIASTAMALPIIEGDISFVGVAKYLGGNTPENAKGIDFQSEFTLGDASGSYAGVDEFTPVTFTDFTFSPTLSPTPVKPLWSFVSEGKTYDFSMYSVVATKGDNSLILNGEGLLGITGFSDTHGSWTMTMQGISSRVTFSATSAAVPEPGMFFLFGTGLIVVAIFNRRKNSLV